MHLLRTIRRVFLKFKKHRTDKLRIPKETFVADSVQTLVLFSSPKIRVIKYMSSAFQTNLNSSHHHIEISLTNSMMKRGSIRYTEGGLVFRTKHKNIYSLATVEMLIKAVIYDE